MWKNPHDFLRQGIWIRSVEKHKSCLSVPLPSRYTAFHRHCQKTYNAQNDYFGESGSKNQETQSLKSEFDHKGFVISRAISTEDLANSMFRKITSFQNSSVMWNADGSFIETEKSHAYGIFPEIELILKGICGQLLSTIYQSHFKVFFVRLYKQERRFAEPEGSQIWHHDTCPGTCIKILFFLNDVGPDNGGTELIPWNPTLQVLKKEWSFNKNIKSDTTKPLTKEEIRIRRAEWYSSHIDRYYSHYKEQVTGLPGTFLLFRPEVLHRGGFPKKDHCRFMLMFSIYPSDVPTPYDHYRRYGIPKRSAFPKDPKQIWPVENEIENRVVK